MKHITALTLSLAILLTGCTQPAAPVTPAPTPEVSATTEPAPVPTQPGKVYTNWSKLTPYDPPKPVYTRRYESYTDTLIPAEDYGELIPFPGVALTRPDSWGQGYYDTYHLYGLMTWQGEVVVDPVFSSAYVMEERDDFGHPTGEGSVLLLTKTVLEDGKPVARTALADPRGRWCTDFLYSFDWEMMWSGGFAGGIPLQRAGNRLALVDPSTGKELWSVDYSPCLPALDPENDWCHISGFDFDREEGWCTANLFYGQQIDGRYVYTDLPLLFDPSGKPVSLDSNVQRVGRFSGGLAPAQDYFDAWGYIGTDGQWVIPPRYHAAQSFADGYAPVQVTGEVSGWAFIDTQGKEVFPLLPCDNLQRHGDYWYFLGYDWDVAAVTDARTLRSVDNPLISYFQPVSFQAEGWVSCVIDEGRKLVLVREMETHSFPADLGRVESIQGDLVLFCKNGENGNRAVTLAKLDGTLLARFDGADWATFSQGPDGEEFLSVSFYSDGEERTDYYTRSGKPILSTQGYQESYIGNGLVRKETEDSFSISTLDGKTIFYWPIPQTTD